MKPIRLADTILPETIFLDVEAADSNSLIQEIARRLGERDDVSDADRLARDAISREAELSTGIDRGVAMPHARTSAVDRLICAFVKPARPVDFGSADGKPCELVFFSAVPRGCVDEYLHFTAAVVRRLQQPDVIPALREATTASAVRAALGADKA